MASLTDFVSTFTQNIEEEDIANLLPDDDYEEDKDVNLIETGNKHLQTDEEESTQKQKVKRKKIVKENNNIFPQYSEIFLKIIYPLSGFMEKNITVGFFKSLDFMPGVLLNHLGKSVLFNEQAWNSFTKNMSLIECYMLNKVFGKKTSIRLLGSDIEVENVKFRCAHCVRFRNLSKHDDKVVLNSEEFFKMLNMTPAVNRYMQQLAFSTPMIKDYLVDAIEKQPNAPLIYGPVDTSIYNRLPHEVHLYRNQCSQQRSNNEGDTLECEVNFQAEEDCSDGV